LKRLLSADAALERRARTALARDGIFVSHSTEPYPAFRLPLTSTELQELAAQVADLLRGKKS
jgi:hypothetical protein